MGLCKTYMQQLSFNGTTYTKGSVVDLLETYNIGCENFPFKVMPEAKELPKRDFPDENGVEVFAPTQMPLKDYEIDVIFIYKGNESSMRSDVQNFLNFLYGRNNGAVGSTFAIYDEHVKIGRKDVRVKRVGNEFFYNEDYDDEKQAGFKVTFNVDDPATDVVPQYSGSTLVALNF